jgi:GDPmannose 4,6-dehydratase
MLQYTTPDDYVLATGNTYSIREFLKYAFGFAGIENWQDYVRKDMRYYRPAEVDVLRGDATKAKEVLGWEPKVTLEQLVHRMMKKEYERYDINQ